MEFDGDEGDDDDAGFSVVSKVLQNGNSTAEQRWRAYRVLMDWCEPNNHVWCQHGDRVGFLSGLLEFPNSDLWTRFQKLLARMNCRSCIASWSESVNLFLRDLPRRFEGYSIEILEIHMIEADAVRLRQVSIAERMFEFMRRIQLSRDDRLNCDACAFLQENAHKPDAQDIIRHDNGRLTPMVYLFCIHPKPVIRSWAQALVRADSTQNITSNEIPASVLTEIVAILTKDSFTDLCSEPTRFLYETVSFWKGVGFLLNISDSETWSKLTRRLLCVKSGEFVIKLLAHSRLIVIDEDGAYRTLDEDVPEAIISPTLDCFSFFMLNTASVFWEESASISPAIMADALFKAILYATRDPSILSQNPSLSLKIIDLIPIFVMSLPSNDRQIYIVSAVRFLTQLASESFSCSTKAVVSLKVHCWSAILKIIRCSYLMKSSPAAMLCCDVWASDVTSLSCSAGGFFSEIFLFLKDCSTYARDQIASEAGDVLAIVLQADADNLKRIFILDEPLDFAVDVNEERLFVSNTAWIAICSERNVAELPTKLLALLFSIAVEVTATPISFMRLTCQQSEDVFKTYISIRILVQIFFRSLSMRPILLHSLLSELHDVLSHLFLLLVSYQESSAHISELIRYEIQRAFKLDEKPKSIDHCLSILLQYQPMEIARISRRSIEFCTCAAVFTSVERLIKQFSPNSEEMAASVLASLYSVFFWVEKLLRCCARHDNLASSIDLEALDLVWKLFFTCIVSGVEFHAISEFDRTFSALYDLGITMLTLQPAILTSFDDWFKTWLLKRELIPPSTRRRWFQFTRSYARMFPDRRESLQAILHKYHGDTSWLYHHGLSDPSHREYLLNLAPAVLSQGTARDPESCSSSAVNNVLKDLPQSSSGNDANLFSASVARSTSMKVDSLSSRAVSLVEQRSWNLLAESKRSVPTPARTSVANYHPSRIDASWLEEDDQTDHPDTSSRISALRSGFRSLREDAEKIAGQNLAKSIVIKPLTSMKSSATIKRRATSARTATSKTIHSRSVSEISLPLRSAGHLMNIVLDWNLEQITGDCLPKTISEMMIKPLPSSFASLIEYRRAYGPLLIEETRAIILNDFQSNRSVSPSIVTKQGLDSTSHSSLPGSLILCTTTDTADGSRLADHDLLLVWPITSSKDLSNPPSHTFFGIVDTQSNANRLLMRVTRSIVTDSKFKHQLGLIRMCSLTTLLRMAKALESIGRLRLAPSLILGQPSMNDGEPEKFASGEILDGLNTSQKSAVVHCVSSKDPVVLLQGPPGTGKTTVIVALVKAILQKYTTLQSKSGVGLGWGKKSSETDGQHILVCAPSNAAADELTGRLVSANIKAIPESVQYPVVRYGNNFNSDSLAETVSLDKLTSYVQPSLLRTGSQHESATTQPSSHERRSMQEMRAKLLFEANVLVCTLAGSGSALISGIPHGFHTVIVDEAAQANEMEALIPLQYCCRKLILVGDPRQLPATVLSPCADKFGLSRSMFERLETTILPVTLTEQYRMHPEICSFPSNQFYSGRVVTAAIERSAPFHSDPFVRPYLFFDVQSEDIMVNFSRRNTIEADFIVKLLLHIDRTVAMHGTKRPSVGVITPYQAQVKEIARQASLQMKYQPDVRTIDSFQGQERDIIVISSVRANGKNDQGKGLGFVADVRRLNVALTRAKLCCLVVGCAKTLTDSVSAWRALVSDARKRSCIVPAPSNGFSEFFQHSLMRKRKPFSDPNRSSKRPNGSIEPNAPPGKYQITISNGNQAINRRILPLPAPITKPPLQIKKISMATNQVDPSQLSKPRPDPPTNRRPPDRGMVKTLPNAQPNPDAIQRQLTMQSTGNRSPARLVHGRGKQVLQPNTVSRTGNVQSSTATLALDDILEAMM